jgi:uncharacterized DUF497 family protein
MLDFDALDGFEWDDGNGRKNEKHGVSRQEAEQVFFNQPLVLLEDPRHSGGEPRFHLLGKTNEDRLLHITFTLRGSGGTKIRVISARSMSGKEKIVYGQATESP